MITRTVASANPLGRNVAISTMTTAPMAAIGRVGATEESPTRTTVAAAAASTHAIPPGSGRAVPLRRP